MTQITLKPELITAGGQAASIMVDEGYVGSFTAIYRENDTLWGMIQLDKERLSHDLKDEIDLFMQDHVQGMADALNVAACNVMVTYSHLSHVLSADEEEEEYDGEVYDEEVYMDVFEHDDYNLVIEWVREDIDTLILDIFEADEEESVYIGRATINVGESDLTCLVDFDHPRHRRLRETLAYHLVDLIEEEFTFDTITITMQYQDEVIDEYHFDYADQEEVIVMEDERGNDPQYIN